MKKNKNSFLTATRLLEELQENFEKILQKLLTKNINYCNIIPEAKKHRYNRQLNSM